MASELTLSVVAPDRLVLEETVQSVILPGSQGYLGVMQGHEPTITSLKTGYLEYQDKNSQRHYVAVGGGFAEILPGKVSVLADSADRRHEIDVAKAEAELEKARAAMRGDSTSMNREQAVLELDKAMNLIKVAKMS
ncbi:MAG TPA: ATP synthase F1 subunit epsilon [Fimbriimonadaceae bacterium]|jgi:F-type H+-transporting ATPase subunit epsilon